jgi:hypothetical protein
MPLWYLKPLKHPISPYRRGFYAILLAVKTFLNMLLILPMYDNIKTQQKELRGMYTYYKKRRIDSRNWWRRIQSRKYRQELVVRSILVMIVTAIMYLLTSLNSGRNVLYLLTWCLIVGIILIPFMLNLRVSTAQKT